jgi:dTMP kinase
MRSREAATGTSADRIELAGAEFHARLRRGFLDLAAAEKDRFDVIDASGSEDEVWEKIWKSTKRFL